MPLRTLFLTLVLTGALSPAFSQPHQAGHGQDSHGHSGQHQSQGASTPYAGFESRRIKALSDAQIADLEAGRGMMLALPAELNGYPGPAHVLELAERLRLTPDQRAKTQALFESMEREAKAAGNAVIEAEASLDALFATRSITRETLIQATARAAMAAAGLRAAHLRYHIAIAELLTPQQQDEYARLRGYTRRP